MGPAGIFGGTDLFLFVTRIRNISRLLIAIAAIALGALLVVPIWRIDLMAPQYPEGLALQIYHDRFTGDVQKINGLNHYIGMATIENDMFPEFAIMRYAFYLLMAWGLVAAISRLRVALLSWLFGLFAFVIWAMWDMYAWGYKYGHDLDPRAAIKVEGMAYQPPLFGHKQLLNFDAWSLPDTGGWVLFAVITIAAFVWLAEWRWPGRTKKTGGEPMVATPAAGALAAILALVFASCGSSKPPEIPFGKAECVSCRMNVIDDQFAAALTTLKGRTYYFDSPECMVQHVADGQISEAQVAHWYVCDHNHPGVLLDATTAYYLRSSAVPSPMGGNTAAFATEIDRATIDDMVHGEKLDFEGMRQILVDR